MGLSETVVTNEIIQACIVYKLCIQLWEGSRTSTLLKKESQCDQQAWHNEATAIVHALTVFKQPQLLHITRTHAYMYMYMYACVCTFAPVTCTFVAKWMYMYM